MTEFRWTTTGTVSEGELFTVCGANVWSHKWVKTKDDAVQLLHPDYPTQTHRFSVYRIEKIKWVEIAIESPAQRQAVLTELAKVHVPGEFTETGFRVLGYAELGVEVNYLN